MHAETQKPVNEHNATLNLTNIQEGLANANNNTTNVLHDDLKSISSINEIEKIQQYHHKEIRQAMKESSDNIVLKYLV